MVLQNENTKTKMKQNQNKTKHQVNSYFRDHLFIFQAKLFADEINTGRINLAVYNANTLTRNDLIGAHEVDLMRVYNSPGNSIFMPFSLLFAHVGCLWFFFYSFLWFFLYFFFFLVFRARTIPSVGCISRHYQRVLGCSRVSQINSFPLHRSSFLSVVGHRIWFWLS